MSAPDIRLRIGTVRLKGVKGSGFEAALAAAVSALADEFGPVAGDRALELPPLQVRVPAGASEADAVQAVARALTAAVQARLRHGGAQP